MFKYLLIAVSVVLAGCSANPKTINDLVEANNKDSFTVDLNYQQVYRNIIIGLETCRSNGLNSSLLNNTAVRTDLFTDISEGRILIHLSNPLHKDKPLTYIRSSKISDKKTEVDVFYTWKNAQEKGRDRLFQLWSTGNYICK